MSEAMHASLAQGGLPDPQQLLPPFLAVSLAVHVLIFLLLPAGQPDAAIAPVPVLDVTMATRELDAPPVHAPQLVPAVTRRPTALPQPAVAESVIPSTPGPMALTQAAPDLIAAGEPRAAAETKAPSRADPPLLPPTFSAAYLRNPAPAYPAIARRNGDQGMVTLKVLVSAEGVSLRVELDQTSGSKSLDDAALEAVKGWRFVPARRGTQNIEAWVRVPVVFKLEF